MQDPFFQDDSDEYISIRAREQYTEESETDRLKRRNQELLSQYHQMKMNLIAVAIIAGCIIWSLL